MERALEAPLQRIAEPEASSGRDPRAALLELLPQLTSAEPEEREELAERINHWLTALAKLEGGRAAELIDRLLDESAFADLRDSNGISCRARAVELLLALGFPHALTVSPEDLAVFRAEEKRRGFSFRRLLARLLVSVPAAVSLAWSVIAMVPSVMLAADGSFAWPYAGTAALLYLVGMGHAALALSAAKGAASKGDEPTREKGLARLGKLGWTGLVFLIPAAVAEVGFGAKGFGLILFAPQLATSLACFLARPLLTGAAPTKVPAALAK